MEYQKGMVIGSQCRETQTPGGKFFVFVPSLFKGERGPMIMVEEKIHQIMATTPVVVKEKEDKNKKRYVVIRSAKPGEETYQIFRFSSGGGQDHRQDHGQFKIDEVRDGIILYDISSWWGSNHDAVVAIKKTGYIKISGNHGAGFKSRNPQPDFAISINFEGKEESFLDIDVD